MVREILEQAEVRPSQTNSEDESAATSNGYLDNSPNPERAGDSDLPLENVDDLVSIQH